MVMEEMELYLLDADFAPVAGPIDTITSLVWEERYFEPGSFTVHIPREALTAFRSAVYFTDGVRCGRIAYTDCEDDDCVVGGQLLEGLLADRRLVGTGTLSGTVTEAVTAAVVANLRGLPIVVGESAVIADAVTLSYKWENLSDWLYAVLKPYGASYTVTLNADRVPEFRVVTGVDRAEGSAAAQPAIFSSSFGNIVSIAFTHELSDWKNTVYMEGGDGTVVTVAESGGTDRREIYKKATDIRPADYADTAAYEAALRRRGAEVLAQYPVALSVRAETDVAALPRYGVDYALGDLCDVVDEALGIAYVLRLTAVDTVYENGLCLICPSFGEEVRRVRRLLTDAGSGV